MTPDHWWGARDRSWGIRPVGEAEPPGIRATDPKEGLGFYHHWLPMQFDDHMIKIMIDEDASGFRFTEEAMRVWNLGSPRASERLGRPELDVDWIPGTREMRSARLTITGADGARVGSTNTPLRTVYLCGGSGYFDDGVWSHGRYQGKLAVECLTHDLSDPASREALCGLNETLCRFELDTGEVGYGMHENMVLGAHVPSGFTADGPSTAWLARLRG